MVANFCSPDTVAEMLKPFDTEEATELLCNELSAPPILHSAIKFGIFLMQKTPAIINLNQCPILAAAKQAILGAMKKFSSSNFGENFDEIRQISKISGPFLLVIENLQTFEFSETDFNLIVGFGAILIKVSTN
jgi:hypothetical protein